MRGPPPLIPSPEAPYSARMRATPVVAWPVRSLVVASIGPPQRSWRRLRLRRVHTHKPAAVGRGQRGLCCAHVGRHVTAAQRLRPSGRWAAVFANADPVVRSTDGRWRAGVAVTPGASLVSCAWPMAARRSRALATASEDRPRTRPVACRPKSSAGYAARCAATRPRSSPGGVPTGDPRTAGMAHQPPCQRGCLRDLIGCGERACHVPGLQCRPGPCGGGRAQRLIRAGCDIRQASRVADPASSFSESGSAAPGAPVSWVAMPATAIAELYGRPRESRLPCPVPPRDVPGRPGGRGRGSVPCGLARLLQGGQLPPGGRASGPGGLSQLGGGSAGAGHQRGHDGRCRSAGRRCGRRAGLAGRWRVRGARRCAAGGAVFVLRACPCSPSDPPTRPRHHRPLHVADRLGLRGHEPAGHRQAGDPSSRAWERPATATFYARPACGDCSYRLSCISLGVPGMAARAGTRNFCRGIHSDLSRNTERKYDKLTERNPQNLASRIARLSGQRCRSSNQVVM